MAHRIIRGDDDKSPQLENPYPLIHHVRVMDIWVTYFRWCLFFCIPHLHTPDFPNLLCIQKEGLSRLSYIIMYSRPISLAFPSKEGGLMPSFRDFLSERCSEAWCNIHCNILIYPFIISSLLKGQTCIFVPDVIGRRFLPPRFFTN